MYKRAIMLCRFIKHLAAETMPMPGQAAQECQRTSPPTSARNRREERPWPRCRRHVAQESQCLSLGQHLPCHAAQECQRLQRPCPCPCPRPCPCPCPCRRSRASCEAASGGLRGDLAGREVSLGQDGYGHHIRTVNAKRQKKFKNGQGVAYRFGNRMVGDW